QFLKTLLFPMRRFLTLVRACPRSRNPGSADILPAWFSSRFRQFSPARCRPSQVLGQALVNYVAMVLLLPVSLAAQQPADTPAVARPLAPLTAPLILRAASTNYLLGANDVIHIKVFREEDLDTT